MSNGLELTLSYDSQTLDLSDYISTYTPARVYTANVKTLITLDGTEHAFPTRQHYTLEVRLKPLTEQEVQSLAWFFTSMPAVGWLSVTYTDPGEALNPVTRDMRLVADWSSKFLLKSIDGERRYDGGVLRFRSK